MTELLKAGEAKNAETMTSLQIAEVMNKDIFSNFTDIDGVKYVSTIHISKVLLINLDIINSLVREYVNYASFYGVEFYVKESVEEDKKHYLISYLETIFVATSLNNINAFTLVQSAFSIEKERNQWKCVFLNMNGNCKNRENQKTYLILDTKSNYCKIGKSINIEDRIKQLSVGNPNLKLLGSCSKDVERKLHKKYKEKKISNEWYDLTDEDVSEVLMIFKGILSRR